MSAVLIRASTAADLPAVEAVRLGTWQVAYRGIVPNAFLDGLEVRPETVTCWASPSSTRCTC